MLDDLQVGSTFKHWALHVTMVPWFVVDDVEEADLFTSFRNEFTGSKGFEIEVGATEYFGPKQDIAVAVLEPYEELQVVHQRTLKWLFDNLHARWAVKQAYVGKDFKPHITQRRETVAQGKVVHFDKLSLVRAKRQEDWQREIAAEVELL